MLGSNNRYVKAALSRAEQEARADGSAAVEAQHLLLAVVADPGDAAGGVLREKGLDRDAIRAALDREFAGSLAAAGVTATSFGLPPASPDPQRKHQLGASLKVALERAVTVAASPAMGPVDLLLGILQAEVGTVPRALSLAGVDRPDLAMRLRQAVAP